MTGRRRIEIRKQNRLLDDFFKVDEVIVAHQRQDGAMSAGRAAARIRARRRDRRAVIR
jgi:hypothetical protein